MGKNVDFLIVGFTGSIGSGCTTLARYILKFKPIQSLQKLNLYEQISDDIKRISEQMRVTEDYSNLKELNLDMQKKLIMRRYLSEICQFNDTNFTYISISSIILKLVFDSINTKKYSEWKNSNIKNKNMSYYFERFNEKWSSVLDDYNKCKNFDELGNRKLEDIDSMLKELEDLKGKVKEIELNQYFRGTTDEFTMQSFGDNIRKSGNPFENKKIKPEKMSKNLKILPNEVNKFIKFYRNRKKGASNHFIIDAFRNPTEIEFFRKRYSQFFVISLYADFTTRSERLKKCLPNIDSSKFIQKFHILDQRDLGKEGGDIEALHKQNVSRCAYLSDIAINNNDNIDKFDQELFLKFLKYYALMISPGCVQPTKEETNMNLAYTLSLRSTCISRKVGAVITDSEGFILGMGWNDVAHSQFGCGLRIKEDLENYQDGYKLELFKDIIDEKDLDCYDINDSFCFKDLLSKSKIRAKMQKYPPKMQEKILKDLSIKRLEFCRALHAEENALLQVASRGGMGVKNGTIYTTTFPCELCAKKIYQSGIKNIYYTEPYPDSISQNVFLNDGIEKIKTVQFEGVKSFSYFRLFKPHLDRKEAQYLHQSYYNLL